MPLLFILVAEKEDWSESQDEPNDDSVPTKWGKAEKQSIKSVFNIDFLKVWVKVGKYFYYFYVD